MRGTAILMVLALACRLSASMAQADADNITAPKQLSANEMIAAADRVRNPGRAFRLSNTITEYIRGAARDRLKLVVYAREDNTTGQFANLVRYVDPPREVGKLVLLDGSRMWFYDPASQASVRISPQQRLIGQAANGDVVTVNLARDYTARIIGQETLQDADRRPRQCWHLDLSAADVDAVYNRIEYWLEQGTYYPVKAKYFADSGRLLKIAYFHKYEEALGGVRPTELIILDAVDQDLVTTMSFSDYHSEEIPDAWFQREFLPHVKAD